MRARHLTVTLLFCACGWQQQDPDFTEHDWEIIERMALTELPAQDPSRARFGQQLFFDTELSAAITTSHEGQPTPLTGTAAGPDGGTVLLLSGRVACANCHPPDSWFSDDRSLPNNVSLGVGWTGRNSPSLVNVGQYSGTFGWDGRSDSLTMQCSIAYTSRRTMAGDDLLMAKTIVAKYAAVFADAGWPLDAGELGVDGGASAIALVGYQSLAAYLMTLHSGNAAIDRFASGDRTALTDSQRRGLKLFIGKAGCIHCHRGAAFTDNGYHNTGIAQLGPRVPLTDLGRSEGIAELRKHPLRSCGDKCPEPDGRYDGLFRTKNLRHVAKTPPYMHAGQLATLADVVEFYDRGGDESGFAGVKDAVMVKLGLSADEKGDLIAFLDALTGEPVDARLRCDSAWGDGVHLFKRCTEGQ